MIIKELTSIEKLGHYEVDGHKYLSKILALTAAKNDHTKVKFYFNDANFSARDWTKEPEPSTPVSEFYRRRAQSLRDKYDYLVLMYSGGPDSQNILDTFVSNDILLDEVINVNSYSKTGVVDGTIHNADYVHNVKPNLDKLLKDYHSPPKITILDEIELTKRYIKERSQGDNYGLIFGHGGFPSTWLFRGIWIKYVDHLWKMMLSGKKVGVILGSDKTNIKLVDGKYCTFFIDIMSVDIANTLNNDGELHKADFLEYFYHSPDCADLVIKQAHALKNFMSANRGTEFYDYRPITWYSDNHQKPPYTCINKYTNGTLKYHHYHKTVYPNWAPDIITHKTENGFSVRQEDCWWMNQLDNSETKFWYNSLVKVITDLREVVTKKRNDGTTHYDMPLLCTRPYFLE